MNLSEQLGISLPPISDRPDRPDDADIIYALGDLEASNQDGVKQLLKLEDTDGFSAVSVRHILVLRNFEINWPTLLVRLESLVAEGKIYKVGIEEQGYGHARFSIKPRSD